MDEPAFLMYLSPLHMTYHDRCSSPREPVISCGNSLFTIWDVDAGPGYAVTAEKSRRDSYVRIATAGKQLVALRTLSGTGSVRLQDGSRFEVTANSLLLFDFKQLLGYEIQSRRWRFWWFEFASLEPLRLPRNQVLETPAAPGEAGCCANIFRLLRREPIQWRCLANAEFAAQLHRWWAAAQLQPKSPSAVETAIHRIIEQMHQRQESHWEIQQMARAAGMSESGFRKAFHAATGKSPKQLYEQIRLGNGYQQLRLGTKSVAEIAESLGYYDTFHFSKAFKRAFGHPPSAVRQSLRPV